MGTIKKLPLEALFNRHKNSLPLEVLELLKDITKFLNDRDLNLVGLLNKGLGFNDNFNGALLSYTSNATPDTQDTVAHGLLRAPTDFIVVNIDKGGVVYKSAAFNATNVFLKCTAASAAVKVFVF